MPETQTNQDEIREGVAEEIWRFCQRNDCIHESLNWAEVTGGYRGLILSITDIVREYEDSKGVVLKVERELPLIQVEYQGDIKVASKAQQDMLKAGYSATEPLIKE